MWFIENDGAVTVEWLGYHIQTSMAFVVLATIILVVLCTTILQILIWIKSAPSRYRKSLKEKRRDKGLTALTEGFAAIAAGDARQAKKLSKKAIGHLGNLPLTKLLSAQTAQLDGDRELAKEHYNSMMLEDKSTEIIAIKGLLIEARKDGDINKAIFLAEKALKIKHDAEWAIKILMDLYKITKQWSKTEDIMHKAYKLKIIGTAESNRTIAMIYMAKCNEAQLNGDYEIALYHAKYAYKLMADFVPIAIKYADLMHKDGNTRRAIKAIESCWEKTPHPQLANAYLKIYASEPINKQLKRAERLLAIKMTNSDGHFMVAKIAIAAGEFSKARNHLKIALSEHETRSICNMMAELEQAEGADQNVIQQWMQRTENADEDLAWICSQCSSMHHDWNVNCNNCASFDSLVWGGGSSCNNHSPTAEMQLIGE